MKEQNALYIILICTIIISIFLLHFKMREIRDICRQQTTELGE